MRLFYPAQRRLARGPRRLRRGFVALVGFGGAGKIGRIRRGDLKRQALAILACVDRGHCADRNRNFAPGAVEARGDTADEEGSGSVVLSILKRSTAIGPTLSTIWPSLTYSIGTRVTESTVTEI